MVVEFMMFSIEACRYTTKGIQNDLLRKRHLKIFLLPLKKLLASSACNFFGDSLHHIASHKVAKMLNKRDNFLAESKSASSLLHVNEVVTSLHNNQPDVLSISQIVIIY